MKLSNLTSAQVYLLTRLETAPIATPTDSYCTDRNDNGIIKGCFNSSTLKALETKGYIIVVKFGGIWGDQVRLAWNIEKADKDFPHSLTYLPTTTE